MFYLFAVFFGLAWGGYGLVVLRLVADTFGGRNLGIIMGVVDMNFMLGGAIGPALAGYVFDTTGSYRLAWQIFSLATIPGIPLVLLAKPPGAARES